MRDSLIDYKIQALLDGELDDNKAAALTKTIAENPMLYKRFMDLKEQNDLLVHWHASIMLN